MLQCCNDDRRRWYVVQTKPKQEARGEANLRRWNIETLAPRVRDYRQRRAAAAARIVPLFPNYLFARFDAETLTAKIRLTRGIQRVVGFGEYATPVDDEMIELIRARIGEDGLVGTPELQLGDAVEIVEGPLQSFVGIFERHVSARDRVIVLLTTIGCRARVQVPATAIRNVADR
jgi:transcriptional antiterminator RfaH